MKMKSFLIFLSIFLLLPSANALSLSGNLSYQSKITAYKNGTNIITATTQTNSSGHYILSLVEGVYDIKYELLNFTPSGFFVKLNSVNMSSNLVDLVKVIPVANKLILSVNLNKSLDLEVYSEKEPSRILIGNYTLAKVASLSELVEGRWLYNSTAKILRIKHAGGIRFRLGASVPSSAIVPQFRNGTNFYNYMTNGPGFFSHIDFVTGVPNIWSWKSEKIFIKEMLDSADKDNGRCEISITLYGVDLGWPEIWKPLLLEFLEAIGPNRKSLRFIFLAGEWSYINRMPPNFDDLKRDFFEARDIVASYGYTLGWQGEGKYFSNVPKNLSSEVLSWGPRCRNAQISYNSNQTKGAEETYKSASGWRSPNDVFLNAFTMWDDAANKPGTAPYYVSYEKFEAYFKAASELFDSTGGQYPQSLTFDVLPITFDASVCPYLQWWSELSKKYNVRIYQSPPMQIKEPTNFQPPSPFPPYPTLIKWTTSVGNLMPFYTQAGGNFSGAILAKEIHNYRTPQNREVEVYLIKQTLRPDSYWRPDHPITRDEWVNNKIFVGKASIGSDGWGLNLIFPAPIEPGRYAVIPRVPGSSTEMEGWADPIESILVAEKTHVVEIKSNVRIRLIFGPTGYGPPWQGVDSQRWVSPSERLSGTCSEASWTFVAPQTTDVNGTVWKFSHWEDGSTNSTRSIFIDRDMNLTATYVQT